MGLSGGADSTTYGLRPGKAPTAAAQAPTAAAQKILDAAASKFASAGTFEVAEQSAGGLSVRKEKKLPTPAKEVCRSSEYLEDLRKKQSMGDMHMDPPHENARHHSPLRVSLLRP